ncbi:MAG: hypothetical protein ABF379_15690 [Akkermansiaceae bacterium]
MNSSTATIFCHAEDQPQDEETGELGEGLSVEVAKAWEKALSEAEVPDYVRKVALRTVIVLGNELESVFDCLRKLAWLGLGGLHGRVSEDCRAELRPTYDEVDARDWNLCDEV